MSTNLKNGSKGDEVKGLQDGLKKLGFDVDVDGHFGPKTEAAVKTLQGFFGYDVDGIAGDGTQKLVTRRSSRSRRRARAHRQQLLAPR
jgi:peptidoglycan hydrolase-like protein with peptidoglycan-binding domain